MVGSALTRRAVEDAKLSALNDDRYHELTTAYESYREECKPCDD